MKIQKIKKYQLLFYTAYPIKYFIKIKKHISIMFTLSLFINSNRGVAHGADKSRDENIEHTILTDKNPVHLWSWL